MAGPTWLPAASSWYFEMLSPEPRRPLRIAVALAMLSQITGINTVSYHGSILLKDYGGQASASSALGVWSR